MATPNITLTGTLKDISGVADAGSVVITLVGYGANVPRISGTAVLAPVSLTVQAAANGTFSTLLWGNDQIDVAGVTSTTYYTVEVKAADGSSLGVYAFQFTGTGSFDLSSLTQYNAPSASTLPAPANAVLTNPTGVQTIQTYELKVPSLGVGQTAISSSATAPRTLTLPDADSVVPEALTAVAHQFLTGLGTNGIFTAAQPSAADLSDGVTGTGAVVRATSPTITTPTINGSGGALTLPAGPDTLVGRATTDTLTNKTLTSPTITNPSTTGTDSGVETLQNKTLDSTNTLPAATTSYLGAIHLPSVTVLTTGSGTYTTPVGAIMLRVRLVGGGGGGTGGGNSLANLGGTGGNTTFGASLTANGGTGTNGGSGGVGGTATGGDINVQGNCGQSAGAEYGNVFMGAGTGAPGPWGGAGRGGYDGAGSNATGPGAGGGGGGVSANTAGLFLGPGGGGGGYVEKWIINPSASYAYSVGAAGTAGTANTNGFAGGAGAAGIIIVEAY